MRTGSSTSELAVVERPRHRNWTPAAVLVLGILSTALLVWSSVTSQREVIQDLAIDDAIRRLTVDIATSHLWLEEILTGDTTIEVTDIWNDLRHSGDLVLLMLQGGSSADDRYIFEPLRDPRLRQQAESVKVQLEALRNFFVERYELGDSAGVGTEMDQSFDQAFLELLRSCDVLRAGLAKRSVRSQARSRLRLGFVVGAWVLVVLAATGGLWNRERRRQQAEATLRQREAELHQAMKMEAVGRLAGGIAHDINNYLGAIRGYCEVVRMKNPDDSAVTRQMDAAMETATEASNLIRQLLAFSRKQPIRPQLIDLNQVVAKMEGMARQLLGDDVTLSTRKDPELRSVEADRSQIEQILLNLLVNSRDAMPHGGEIVVTTSNVEKSPEQDAGRPAGAPGRYVVLSVHDSGHGIAPENREKIFEPFFTTKVDMGSSGLGLATVYGIVRQSGGFIEVASQPQQGTTFEIYLPAQDRSADRGQTHAVSEAPLATGPVKVLLVEDNDHMRDSTEGLLQALGHDVLVAADGEQALRILAEEQQPPDLVITDVVMPGLSGPELLARIREERNDVPCLFISGYTDNVVLRYGLEQEKTDFLQKPFTARNLSLRISEILKAPDS